MTGSKRLSQAISEGDGISFIASVGGPDNAREAERDGAKAVLVYDRDVLAPVAEAVAVPVLFFFDGEQAEALRGADACVVAGDVERLEEVHVNLADEFELAIRVEDDDQLEEVLERFDPEIVVLGSGRGERLSHVLDLLSDVPAGKLAIAELEDVDEDAIDELERAGCDAVLFGAPAAAR